MSDTRLKSNWEEPQHLSSHRGCSPYKAHCTTYKIEGDNGIQKGAKCKQRHSLPGSETAIVKLCETEVLSRRH